MWIFLELSQQRLYVLTNLQKAATAHPITQQYSPIVPWMSGWKKGGPDQNDRDRDWDVFLRLKVLRLIPRYWDHFLDQDWDSQNNKKKSLDTEKFWDEMSHSAEQRFIFGEVARVRQGGLGKKLKLLNRFIMPLCHWAACSDCQWYYSRCYIPPKEILNLKFLNRVIILVIKEHVATVDGIAPAVIYHPTES